jgi:hypothetical protein
LAGCGIRRVSIKKADDVSFVHIASIETEDGSNPLDGSQSFRAFQEGIRDRCEEPPVAVELQEIGSYRVLGEP